MSVDTMNYKELHEENATQNKLLGVNDISLISTIEVVLDVVIGRARISVSDLYELNRGSVLELDADVNSPVQIMLNDNVVAQGILVVSGDNYGVEITNTIHDDGASDS